MAGKACRCALLTVARAVLRGRIAGFRDTSPGCRQSFQPQSGNSPVPEATASEVNASCVEAPEERQPAVASSRLLVAVRLRSDGSRYRHRAAAAPQLNSALMAYVSRCRAAIHTAPVHGMFSATRTTAAAAPARPVHTACGQSRLDDSVRCRSDPNRAFVAAAVPRWT